MSASDSTRGNASQQDYIERWLDHEPEARIARMFVAQARNVRCELIEAIADQLLRSMFGVSDSTVALARLGWWLDELGQSTARHPLTSGLVAAGAVDDPRAGLRGAAVALLRLAQCETVQTLDELQQALQQFCAAVTLARQTVEIGVVQHPLPIAAVAAARLLALVRHWSQLALAARALLPLDLLARHAGNRASAADPAHPLAATLAADLIGSARTDLGLVPAEILRGIDGARVAAASAWAVQMARSPAQTVNGTLAAPRWSLVFALWRVGRRG